jgi:limonene-1,2-epoxide hydrolase
MTLSEIAKRLVALCREGKYEQAQTELYAQDAVSIEPQEMPGFPKVTKGRDAIVQKGRNFVAMIEEIHASEVSDPIVAGSSFACTMRLDSTMRGMGRMDRTELCVYEVKDGKISAEIFHD